VGIDERSLGRRCERLATRFRFRQRLGRCFVTRSANSEDGSDQICELSR
jgi:hypothetical protein